MSALQRTAVVVLVAFAGLAAPTAAVADADLSVTMTDTPDPVVAGHPLTYTITVSNLTGIPQGPADDATLTDTLPPGTTFVSLTAPATWNVTAPAPGATGTVTATPAAPFNPGDSATFTLVVEVDPSNGGFLGNTATVSSPTGPDPNPSNNSITATTAVQTRADVSVTMSDPPDPVLDGTNVAYTIQVSNTGPSDAQNVSLTDTLPPNTTFVSLSVPGGWNATTPAVGATGTVTASRPSLGAGSSGTFTLVVNVDPGTPDGTAIINTATIGSSTTDTDAQNDSDTATTHVGGARPDLAVTKTAAPDPVIVGQNLVYSLVLANNGSGAASNVTLSDALPAGTTFVSMAQTSGPAFTTTTPAVGATGTVTATNPSFASGATATFTLVVDVGSSVAHDATISNTASATTSTGDMNTSDNSDTATATAKRSADLSVTKADSPDSVAPGDNLTYTIRVANAGPHDAQAVELTDVIPGGTTFVSAAQTSGPAFTLAAPVAGGGGTFRATRATLASNAEAEFAVVVRVDADRADGSTIQNTATVDGATVDQDASDDSATATSTVQRPAPAPASDGGGAAPPPPINPPATPQAPRRGELRLGTPRMRTGSGVVFAPVTCEFARRGYCISDVTITFNTRHHRLAPITVRNVHVGVGQTVDVYIAASKAQRRRMRRIGTMPITVTATDAPEAEALRPGLLKGKVRRRR